MQHTMTAPLNYRWTVELRGHLLLVLRYRAECDLHDKMERLTIKCFAEDFSRSEGAVPGRALEYLYEDEEHRITLTWPPLCDKDADPEVRAERVNEDGIWAVVDANIVRGSLRLTRHILH